jgi:hypothetical protein
MPRLRMRARKVAEGHLAANLLFLFKYHNFISTG